MRVIFARRQDARREGTGGARLGSHGHRPRDGGLLARRDAGQVTSGGRRVRRAGVRKDAAKLPHHVTTVGQQPQPQTGSAAPGSRCRVTAGAPGSKRAKRL